VSQRAPEAKITTISSLFYLLLGFFPTWTSPLPTAVTVLIIIYSSLCSSLDIFTKLYRA